MTERLLSSGDVCEITGLEPHVLHDWCTKGIIRPVKDAEGPGTRRQFTLMQAVGIAVAIKVYTSDRGYVLSYAAKVVEAFSSQTEEDLANALDAGRCHFVMVHQGKPLLDGVRQHWQLNVRQIYDEATAAVAQIEKRLEHSVGGRPRGLAGACKRGG